MQFMVISGFVKFSSNRSVHQFSSFYWKNSMNKRSIFFRKCRFEIKRLKQKVIWLFRNIFFYCLAISLSVFRVSRVSNKLCVVYDC